MDLQHFLGRIETASSTDALDAIEQELFGRKSGVLTLELRALGALREEEKKERGQELNRVKTALTDSLTERRRALTEKAHAGLASEIVDMTIDLPDAERGHYHPVNSFIRDTEECFGRMGFDVAYGPEIETEEYNFNLLNIPADHPARDSQDTFWVSGKRKTVLRTHTSPVQIRYMRDKKPPLRMICPGKVYRKDSDATHSPMFHQFEGVMVGEDISIANMKAVMETAVKELIAPDAEFRWRTGYFPFVEPGMEMDMRWRGDESQSREGKWLEICGCGIIHPKVLENVGIDAKKFRGFAFGFGIERMIMIRDKIPDLRLFYSGDLRFLRQF